MLHRAGVTAAARAFPAPSHVRHATCTHCGVALAEDSRKPFCCSGCEAVWAFLHEAKLDRYYDLRGPTGVPALAADPATLERADHQWLEALVARLAERGAHSSRTTPARVELDVQGMHCSACVWLVDTLFRREPGSIGIVVNPAVGRTTLTIEPTFDLRHFVAIVEGLGYRFGPPLKTTPNTMSDVVWRMGVCIAIAMNTMILAVAVYAGLREGPIFRLFEILSFVLSFVSVVVGGSVFFRSAIQALRRGVLHLDLPIALGIFLAFASSTYASLTHIGGTYFDTLNVFIALMLVGRFLQERVLVRNRADILASSGAEHVFARRVRDDDRVELVACRALAEGDRLLVGKGELVPVDVRLGAESRFSLDWINGESRPKHFLPGDVVPAGAFSCNEHPTIVQVVEPFEASSLASLLRTTRTRETDRARTTPFWQRLTKVYVAAVLFVATSSFLGWWLVTRDLARSVEVVTALLIVTCPCAFGIAAPLAYELTQAGLRRVGLFVRSASFLDRAANLRHVVFDKTGTLTTGTLDVDADAFTALDEHERGDLYVLSSHSSHPKSVAITRALEDRSLILPSETPEITEHAGLGVEARIDGHRHRLGAPHWTGADAGADTDASADVVYTVDGRVRASCVTREALRDDAVDEIRALHRMNVETSMLSGDATTRVHAVARTCGIDPSAATGDASPETKASVIRAVDRGDVLFLGDGINDALAAEAATCSGTPAIDRPFMASKSDFYVVTAGLRPVRVALLAAKKLARVVRANLTIAVAYNVVTVALAVAGKMSPLACAVLMPLSSLSTVLLTTFALGRRSALWRS